MKPTPRLERFLRIFYAALPLVVLAMGAWLEYVAVVRITQGKFVYSLDDAYIHLALAERIASGFYGINPGEAAAPASSILWPFLLTPWVNATFFQNVTFFQNATFFELVPLALNLLAAAAAVGVYRRLGLLVLDRLPPLRAQAGAAWIAVFLIPTTNLIGLAFNGMEHTLQVLLCAAIVYGLARVLRGKHTPWWLVAALGLAPAVRYECLAVSLPGLAVLLAARRWRAFAAGLALMLLPLASFSLFLRAQGLDWLPSSVVAKAGTTGELLSAAGMLARISDNLEEYQGVVLAGMILFLLGWGLAKGNRPWIERAAAVAGAAGGLAHLMFGQFGWWERYEVYMLAFTALLALYLTRAWFARVFERGILAILAVLAALSLLLGAPYYACAVRTPLAAANIYEQQYQMHRFAVDFLDAPVGVNDLGWVSFRNPNYVLDLWGLASAEALHSRTQAALAAGADLRPGALNLAGVWGGDWMDELAREHGVGVVMIYDEWFFGGWNGKNSLPEGWTEVAKLHLGHEWVVAGEDTVSFYVLDSQEAERIRGLLAAFRETLPPGVRMEITQ